MLFCVGVAPRRGFTSVKRRAERETMTNKHICRVCEVELDDENWYPAGKKSSQYICKDCKHEQSRLYQETNRDKINAKQRLYRETNRDKINAKQRLYREANKDKINAKQRLYREENRDKTNVQSREWRKNNPEKAKAMSTKAHRKEGCIPMNKNKECSAYYGVHINEGLLKRVFKNVEVMPYGHTGYDFICDNGKKIDGKSSMTGDKGHWAFNINHNTTADYFFCVAYDNRTDLNIIHIWLLPGDKFSHLGMASISLSTIHKWDEYEQPLDKAISCCDSMKLE